MRYSTALVLGTVAVSQASNLRHASFHARRQAEVSKRGIDSVNWEDVTYDLSNVDWDKVFPTPGASSVAAPVETPAPTPTPTPTPVESAPVESAPAKSTPVESAPAESAPAQVYSSKAETPATTTTAASKPTTSSTIGGAVTDLLQGVETVISKLGFKGVGVNSLTANGGLYISDEGAWKTVFTNDAADDLVVFCWEAKGFSGMSLNVNLAAISVGLKPGESVTVSFTEGVPSACAPAYPDTEMALFGGLKQTWYEATFGPQGAYDISKNINMHGNSISAKGSKCVSDMTTCVFECADASASSCETGYQIAGMDAPGCGGGYDPIMKGVGGGCSMGASGETVQVTFT